MSNVAMKMVSTVKEWLSTTGTELEGKTLSEPPQEDDVMGGRWGNAITWNVCDMENNDYSVYGHKPPRQRLKVGSIIKAEMQTSWIWFKIVSIKLHSNPSDMFSAKMEAMHQELK